MRVDKLKKWTDFRDEVVAISRPIAVAQTQPTPMDIGAVGKGNQARVTRDRKLLANATIRLSKHVPGAATRVTLLQIVLALTKRAENVERLVIWQVCVDLLELLSPRPRVVRRTREVAKVQMLSKLVGTVVRVDTCRRNAPRRRSMRWKNPPLRVRLAVRTQTWLDRSKATSVLAA